MYPVILDIYGPIKINSFSLCLLISIFVIFYLLKRDKNISRLFDKDDIINLLSETVIVSVIGGRLLHVINDFKSYSNIIEVISIWNGGLAVIGALLSGGIYLSFMLFKRKLNIVYILDIIMSYLPIANSIARIGCFLAGCCYGISCDKFWAINSQHPTQLYSSLIFLVIFIVMQSLYLNYKLNNIMPGALFTLYLIFFCLERFCVDFVRADRDYYITFNYLSKAQVQSSILFFITMIVFLMIFYNKKETKYKYV